MRLLPDVFISDVVQPGLPTCPSQHPHFGRIDFKFLSSFFFYCPTFRTVCHWWSDDCFEDFVFQFLGHNSIIVFVLLCFQIFIHFLTSHIRPGIHSTKSSANIIAQVGYSLCSVRTPIILTRYSMLPRDGATACMGAKSNPPPQSPSVHQFMACIFIYSTKWP